MTKIETAYRDSQKPAFTCIKQRHFNLSAVQKQDFDLHERVNAIKQNTENLYHKLHSSKLFASRSKLFEESFKGTLLQSNLCNEDDGLAE